MTIKDDLLRAAAYLAATNDSPDSEASISGAEADRIARVLRRLADPTAKLPQELLDFDQYLNEPPEHEHLRDVREFRHAAYRRWEKVVEAIRPLCAAAEMARPTLGDGAEQRVEQHIAAARGEPLRHATKENGDCPHWCKACAAEAADRAAPPSSATVMQEGESAQISEGDLWALIHKDFPFAHGVGRLLTFGEIKVVVERALALAPSPVAPTLAKHQPCGCVLCTCEDPEQCHGCGAKHCGTHPIGEFPAPVAAAQQGEPTILERWGRADEGSGLLLQRRPDGYWTPWHIAQQALQAAASPAPAAGTVPPRVSVTADDLGLGDDGPIGHGWQITVTEGHAGFGVYAHMSVYPDEGAIFLCAVPEVR